MLKEAFMIRLNRWLTAAFLAWAPALLFAQPLRFLDDRLYHLGAAGDPEWSDYENKMPHGRRLDIKFRAQTNANESTLFLRQRDVKLEWAVELNGRKLGKLFLAEQDMVQFLVVPGGTLSEGENTLSILPPKE